MGSYAVPLKKKNKKNNVIFKTDDVGYPKLYRMVPPNPTKTVDMTLMKPMNPSYRSFQSAKLANYGAPGPPHLWTYGPLPIMGTKSPRLIHV